MTTVLYYAGLVVLIFLIILIVYLISFIKTLNKKVTEVEQVIKNLETNVNVIANESASLLQSTTILVDDLQEKSTRINSVVEAIGSVGDAALELKQVLESSFTSLAKINLGATKAKSEKNKQKTINGNSENLSENKTLIQKLTTLALAVKAGMEIWQKNN